MQKKRLMLIDGRHLLWRSAVAYSSLTHKTESGLIPTGAMYGFISTMVRLSQKYRARTIVAWEGETNFRHAIFSGYKKRSEVDEARALLQESVIAQQDDIISLIKNIGVTQYAGVNCEADDVIGRLSCVKRNVYIYSGDSDLLQLVSEKNVAICPGGKNGDVELYPKDVFEKLGVWPGEVPTLKALAGDSSDKIPGVLGIGVKKAAKLISVYRSIDKMLSVSSSEDTDWPLGEREFDAIKNSEDNLRMYLKLTKIRKNVSIRRISPAKNRDLAMRTLREYGFKTFLYPSELVKLFNLAR